MNTERKSDIIIGKVYVLGDDIDTDQIIPAQYLNLVPTIPEEYRKLGSYAMAGLPNSCPVFINEGCDASEYSIIVAGRNFGCGSSREHAPVCLGAAGIEAVVAESYARIFFRNSVATGEVYPLESTERLCDVFRTGDEAEICLSGNSITRLESRETYILKPLGAVQPVIEAGGIFGYARSTGMIGQESGVVSDEGQQTVDYGVQTTEVGEQETEHEEHTTASVPSLADLRTKVVAITNQKGGVGKTTTAVNLASYLAFFKQRVLLLDLDPQTNATSGLGLDRQEGKSIYLALMGDANIPELVQHTQVDNVDILPSELDLAGAEVDIARTDGYLHCLSRVLLPFLASADYDYVIVDCPPSLGILTMNALTSSHSMIIPMQCEYYALEGLSVITHLMDKVRDSGANPLLDLEGILMTMYDRRTNLAAEVVKEVRKHFGRKVYQSLIPRNIRLSEAPSFGQPIMLHDGHCSGALAYKKLAREFLRQNTRIGAPIAGSAS